MRKQKYTRSIKFEYYRVVYRKATDPATLPDRPFDLRRWIVKAHKLSLTKRTMDYYQERARLEHYSQDGDFTFLHFMRLRDTNLPSLAKEAGKAELIQLKDDEYLGEDVSALFDALQKVLVLQRNRNSLSVSGIENYLNLVWAEKGETIYLRPILLLNPGLRARRAFAYRKIRIRFADLDQRIFEGKSGLRSIVAGIGEYKAVGAEITITLGRTAGSLHPQTVINTIDDVYANKDMITKAELVKKTDDTSVEYIDLFDDKMHTYATVTVDRKRTISHDDIVPKLREVYDETKRAEIKSSILNEQGGD